jgi:hypothetical protein
VYFLTLFYLFHPQFLVVQLDHFCHTRLLGLLNERRRLISNGDKKNTAYLAVLVFLVIHRCLVGLFKTERIKVSMRRRIISLTYLAFQVFQVLRVFQANHFHLSYREDPVSLMRLAYQESPAFLVK